MAYWKLLGRLPEVRSREELKVQELDGWNPWQFMPSSSDEPPIVVPDPHNPKLFHHLKVQLSGPLGTGMKYAALHLQDAWWFYVPSTLDAANSFDVQNPLYEGLWRARPDEESYLPWPEPAKAWLNRSSFLKALSAVETRAERVVYRGYSHCRLCGCLNGHEAFRLAEWEWPSGFKHYLEDHGIRPSAHFEDFIMAARIMSLAG